MQFEVYSSVVLHKLAASAQPENRVVADNSRLGLLQQPLQTQNQFTKTIYSRQFFRYLTSHGQVH